MNDEDLELKELLREAFTIAINKIGLEAFKKTSFFGSNQKNEK